LLRPIDHGFGTSLLRAVFADVRIDYLAEGFTCEIDLLLGPNQPGVNHEGDLTVARPKADALSTRPRRSRGRARIRRFADAARLVSTNGVMLVGWRRFRIRPINRGQLFHPGPGLLRRQPRCARSNDFPDADRRPMFRNLPGRAGAVRPSAGVSATAPAAAAKRDAMADVYAIRPRDAGGRGTARAALGFVPSH
jgi:hypothetical protein